MLELNKIYCMDCLEGMKELDNDSIDSIVTDPPYGISFMGKKWDYDVPSIEVWEECLRVLKPGGYLLSFAGTRTQHRMACNIEDAGFEIRDMIAWVYGSGFPKSLDISKAIDSDACRKQLTERLGRIPTKEEFKKEWEKFRHVISETKTNSGGMAHISKTNAEHGFRPNAYNGHSLNEDFKNIIQLTAPATPEAKQWEGWGTALKPALEPITVARKPFKGTVAENVLKHGTGGINIDECRVQYVDEIDKDGSQNKQSGNRGGFHGENTGLYGTGEQMGYKKPQGRFPANLIHDGSDEVVSLFPDTKSGNLNTGHKRGQGIHIHDGGYVGGGIINKNYGGDSGSASRFFYCAKASKEERNAGCEYLEEKETKRYGDFKGTPEHAPKMNVRNTNNHPTVKPLALMEYLVKFVTPPKGVVLDPYIGSGTTALAAKILKYKYIGFDDTQEYIDIANARLSSVVSVVKTFEDVYDKLF